MKRCGTCLGIVTASFLDVTNSSVIESCCALDNTNAALEPLEFENKVTG